MTRLMVMSTESLAAVKAAFSEVIDRVEKHHERVTVTRRGKEAAVILSTQDLQAMEETIRVLSDPQTMRRLHEADAAVAAGDVMGEADLRGLLKRSQGE